MKKLNLIVGIFVVAAILVLLVLLVATFFRDDEENTPPPVSAPPVSATATPTPAPTDDIPEIPLPSEDVSTTPIGEPLEGETLEILAFIGRERLTVTYNSELFRRERIGDGEQFFLKADDSNKTFVEIVFVEDDLETRKAGFLDWYIPDFTSMDTLGQVLIAGSSVAAEGLSATNGALTVDAWLVEVTGGFFAVVAGYSNDNDRAELFRMLDTITFSM